jgi:hypothetical protein
MMLGQNREEDPRTTQTTRLRKRSVCVPSPSWLGLGDLGYKIGSREGSAKQQQICQQSPRHISNRGASRPEAGSQLVTQKPVIL